MKWWRRRDLNSLSNSSIFHDNFSVLLWRTPNNYAENAGCSKTASDYCGLYRT
jgi:hypothetical protein